MALDLTPEQRETGKANFHRAVGELGWRAATPLAEGIQRVYQWIKAGAPDRASY